MWLNEKVMKNEITYIIIIYLFNVHIYIIIFTHRRNGSVRLGLLYLQILKMLKWYKSCRKITHRRNGSVRLGLLFLRTGEMVALG